MSIGGRIHSAAEVDRCHSNRNTVLAVIDAPAVGKYVDVGAFGAKLAVTLTYVTQRKISSCHLKVRRNEAQNCHCPSLDLQRNLPLQSTCTHSQMLHLNRG